MYSEKATKFYKIFTLLLSYEVPVKSKLKISQNFVASSEYMNCIHMNFDATKTTLILLINVSDTRTSGLN